MPRESKLPDLPSAVALCRQNAVFIAALRDAYFRADQAVEQRGLNCRADGDCCKFDRFAHRLYASTGELALLVEAPPTSVLREGRCPYQADPRCTARARRPLGCRVFFCDPAHADWINRQYEQFHAEIRALHDKHDVPYLYMELTDGLRKILPAGQNKIASPDGNFCVDTGNMES